MQGMPAGGRPLKYTAGIMEEQAVELFRAFYIRGNPKGVQSASASGLGRPSVQMKLRTSALSFP